jgi:hypothetical protein
MQRCPDCKLERDRSWYTASSWGNLGMPCAPCKAIRNRATYADPTFATFKRLQQQHKRLGIGGRRLEEMLKAQDWRCACCRTQRLDELPARDIVADRDPDTGFTQALICHTCRKAVRAARRRPSVVAYVKRVPRGNTGGARDG